MTTVRRARATDADAIAALESLAALHPWSPIAVRDTLLLPTTLAFVLGDPPHGYILASRVLDEGEILTLGVHPEARRRGAGTHLLDAVHTAWGESGVRAGFLEVRASNDGARALYTRAGWEESGRRAGYYGVGEDAILMRWAPC